MRSQRRQAPAARILWATRAMLALADPCHEVARQQPKPLACQWQTVIACATSQCRRSYGFIKGWPCTLLVAYEKRQPDSQTVSNRVAS